MINGFTLYIVQQILVCSFNIKFYTNVLKYSI